MPKSLQPEGGKSKSQKRKKEMGKAHASKPTLAMQPVYSSFIPASNRRFEPGLRCHQPTSCVLYGPVHQGGFALDTRLRACVRVGVPARPLLSEKTFHLPAHPSPSLYCSRLPCSPSARPARPQVIPGPRNKHSRFSMVPADASRDEQTYVGRTGKPDAT
jgi:hypothetical protein